MPPLILLIVGLSGVHCDGLALHGFRTIVSAPGSGLPLYTLLVYFDNQQILKYTSDTQQSLVMVEWMKKLDPNIVEWETKRITTYQPFHINHLHRIMNRFNHTAGLHIVQAMFGCELRDDGSTAGYYTYGYDGREFMFLDTQNGIYIPTMNEAQISTQHFNSPEFRQGEFNKRDVEIVCVEYLKKIIECAKEDLEKRVRPEVKVWSHRSGGETKLHCLVYGFHPRVVDVKWMRNGTDHIPSDEASPILPHPDGTYQIRISVEVPTGEEDSYSCHVDHSSLDEIARVKWEPDNGRQSNVIVIIAVIAGLAALAAVIAGVAFYIRRRGEQPTDKYYSSSETSSESTNNPTA